MEICDTLCSGCLVNEESGEEVLRCTFLGENIEKISYGWFYSKLVSEQISAGKIMMKKLKTKDKIVEEITWKLMIEEKMDLHRVLGMLPEL